MDNSGLLNALLGRVQQTYLGGLQKDYRILPRQKKNRAAHGGAYVRYVNVNLDHCWHGSRDNQS